MNRRVSRLVAISVTVILTIVSNSTEMDAQWRNRYPMVDGFPYHIYLEGYELPSLTIGPIDPAPSPTCPCGPNGQLIAFSSRGWIWMLDQESGVATRLTHGAEMDSRPAWSPDGQQIAFVRDNDHDTWIVVLEIQTGVEIATIQTPAIDLDPVFSPDGRKVIYSSAEAGDLDLWTYDLESGDKFRLTNDSDLLELRPQMASEGMLYLSKTRRGIDRIMFRTHSGDGSESLTVASANDDTVLIEGRIASQARPALSPDGTMVVFNWPTQSGWELRLLQVENPGPHILLVDSGVPLTPAWNRDGSWIYFSAPDDMERMQLKKIPSGGGSVESVEIRSWDWGEPTALVRVRTELSGVTGPVPARLNVIDQRGHPAVPNSTAVRFDGQSGRVFFYSPGVVELTIPAGSVTVSAVQGLATPEVSMTVETTAGSVTELIVHMETVWDAREAGWTSGEHHFHLNYGGQYDLSPSDLVLMMQGENLDVATPLLANLHNRFEDQHFWMWEKSRGVPLIRFGQEIRSHFLGHMGLIETSDLHWPWVWGPGYQVYGRDDRTNSSVLDFAHAQGGLGYYVHPVSHAEPFTTEGLRTIPVELVVDGVLGDMDAIELVCLWSNEVGTAEVWYRLLNIGVPVAPSAGTDVMTDFYRTMAVGTTRVYAWTGDAVNWPAYLTAWREGRSFVTNGPLLDFKVEGSRPGGVVQGGVAQWNLDLRSASAVSYVEIIVNGEIVWSSEGLSQAGEHSYSGKLELPVGGWVAARATGGETSWPSMADVPYGHTSPIWIGERGSTDPAVQRVSAQDLLKALEVAHERLVESYEGAEIPQLLARFSEARTKLENLIGTP